MLPYLPTKDYWDLLTYWPTEEIDSLLKRQQKEKARNDSFNKNLYSSGRRINNLKSWNTKRDDREQGGQQLVTINKWFLLP